MNTNCSRFVVTNHLAAEADEDWITTIMGDFFHNSQRSDLYTRPTRIYFAPFDEFVARPGAQPHRLNLNGFDGPRAAVPTTWNRSRNRFVNGYRLKDLEFFAWRCEFHGGRRMVITAERINEDRWSVAFETNQSIPRGSSVARAWFRMIDQETLHVKAAEDIVSLAVAAGESVQTGTYERVTSGVNRKAFDLLAAMAEEQGHSVTKPLFAVLDADHNPPELQAWWQLVLDHPDEMPSYRDFEAYHAWCLRHAYILYVRWGSNLPLYFSRGSRTATENQVVQELVKIGNAVVGCEAGIPSFSFRPFMRNINWQPATCDATREDRVLRQASERLGWQMH